jgi:peptidoglycan/LPS O-acetylase OafA/YrhL
MPKKSEYLSNLTPLRGIAALLVAIFHFEMAIARFVPVSKTMFFEKCYLMVDLFFVMSGFIIYHVYGMNFNLKMKKEALSNFFVARFARTYPLHFFSLLLLILLILFLAPPGTYPNMMEYPAAIPANFFLLQSFHTLRIYTWNIPSWSISAEWAAYALFPLIALFIMKKRKLSVIVLLLVILSAYLSIMFLLPRRNPLNPAVPVPHNINTTFDYGFLRGIAGFITGILIYLLYESEKIKRFFGRDVLAFITLFFLILFMHFALNDGFCVILFALLVLCFACNTGRLHAICNNRILQFLGLISYSIYLMQIFFQDPFSKGLRLPNVTGFGRGKQNIDFGSGLMYCVIYLVGLVAISTITYFTIENPCRKFINRKWGNKKFDNVVAANLGIEAHS